MERPFLFGLAVWFCASAAFGQSAPSGSSALYRRFDSQLSSSDQLEWLKLLGSEPNHVGSPHDKTNADWILSKFREFGWDARIETFQVLYPTPVSEAVEMGGFKAT